MSESEKNSPSPTYQRRISLHEGSTPKARVTTERSSYTTLMPR
jgi:hypothetical protein